ncbi:nucleoside recognition domain-containing protein [Nitratidesulfovibrio sp. 1201_IL3209]|uniref:nucleoside recognition domain-containing protein n=1 Tax=Nitratidesulfovibrio sp. 1201_IL3209 TaxID=3084053 RepID=UPI002FDB0E5D
MIVQAAIRPATPPTAMPTPHARQHDASAPSQPPGAPGAPSSSATAPGHGPGRGAHRPPGGRDHRERAGGRRASRMGVALPLLACAVALGAILARDPKLLAWHSAWPGLVRPLLHMLVTMGVGLAVGLAVEAFGWTPLLARLARPVTRWGRLPDDSGAAFATAFLSAAASNSLLMEAHMAGRLSPRELRLSYLLNSGLPVFLLHLPTTFFVVGPLARTAGIIYLTLNGVAALLRTALVLLLTRRAGPPEKAGGPPSGQLSASPRASGPHVSSPRASASHISGIAAPATLPERLRSALALVGTRFRRRIGRMALFTAPTYLAMYALHQAGVFDALRDLAAGGLDLGILPVQAAGVVVFSAAAEFSAGVAAAAALLDAGSLDTAQTALALVLGTIVATPIRALRHQLPSHTGIFTPRLGLVLLVQSQLFRVASLAAVTAAWWIAAH